MTGVQIDFMMASDNAKALLNSSGADSGAVTVALQGSELKSSVPYRGGICPELTTGYTPPRPPPPKNVACLMYILGGRGLLVVIPYLNVHKLVTNGVFRTAGYTVVVRASSAYLIKGF